MGNSLESSAVLRFRYQIPLALIDGTKCFEVGNSSG